MDYWGIIVLVTGMSFIIKMGFSLNQWFREDIAPDGFKRVDKPNYAHIEMLERELFPEWFKSDQSDQPYWSLYPTASRSLYAPANPKDGDIWLQTEIEKANIINTALRSGIGYVPQEYEFVTYDGTGRVVQRYDTRPKALAEPGVIKK